MAFNLAIIHEVEQRRVGSQHLVLLPGLDGSGQMFADFLTALPDTLTTTVVEYPTERFLPYTELLQFVTAAIPKIEPFVILAESYSTPIALKYAATNPSNLAALIICAGFVQKPVGNWSRLVKMIAKPWIFTLRPPRFFLEYFLIGRNAPAALIERFRQTLQLVHPEVLSARVREVLDCDARNDLTRTKVPIMYMRALHDRLLSASCHKQILRIRPDIVFAAVQAPHLLVQREPQKVANLVVAFVAKS
jgi:pimeloyl-[acyl-carrier protein] methyl ester esterase